MSVPVDAGTLRGATGGVVSVAIEVSALRGGDHVASEFVAFALAALDGAADLEPRAWSARPVRRLGPDGVAVRRRWRGPLGERLARLGAPIASSWAAPSAEVLFEASGPLALRARTPGVLTVHDVERGDAATRRRRRERLSRAAGEGVVLHVLTSAGADELADVLAVPRGAIVVAAPGVRAPRPAPEHPSPASGVTVLQGSDASKDQAVLDGLLAAGASAQLASIPPSPPGICCMLAAPDDGFPQVALEALAAGCALVVTRTPTTTELLEGAATLVDAGSTHDVVEAVMELCGNDAARAIAVAAGRARADDFTWAARAAALAGVVRRTLSRP